jgi:hypothetical protein
MVVLQKLSILLLAMIIPSVGFSQGEPGPLERTSYDTLQKAFHDPPSFYRSAPLWVWNDRVTKQQIEEQLLDFRNHGFGGVFIHPRPGLITPYLSEEWLALCRHAVTIGKKLGLKVWLYDENSYPSGFAGGHVPAALPEAVKTGLKMVTAQEMPAQFEVDPLIVLAKDSSGFADLSSQARKPVSGVREFKIFTLVRSEPSSWFGGFSYVDLMRPEVTRKFLEITMGAYKRAIGDEFGGVVPGVFQDEAEINPPWLADAPVISYTPALFQRFTEKWGYDLRTQLPSLFEDVGDWKRVRHNYYATLLDLFIAGWARPYYEYCTENRLLFTGHYWEHEWPRPAINPDNLAFAAYAHMPGIDVLMNEFRTDTHAQFGNARAVREIRSAANQLGRERTLSETFGAGGWDMTFFDQKRIADWEYALGVNFVNQHLSYVTIKGARKRDHPLSFSYHEPWWGAYRMLADYYGRLSVAMSAGVQDNRVLVLEPTTTAWMHYAPKGKPDVLQSIGDRFQNFVNRLEAAQVEYDLASEDMLRSHGSAQDGKLTVGRRTYELVVLPPTLENLDGATLTLIGKYLAQHGRLLCYGPPPKFVDGVADSRIERLAASQPEGWVTSIDEGNVDAIFQAVSPAFAFGPEGASRPTFPFLFHQRRTFDGFELLFLANTDSSNAAQGSFTAKARACEMWDPFTGNIAPYPSTVAGGRLAVEFMIPPGGSLLLCLRDQSGASMPSVPRQWAEVPAKPIGAPVRLGPNVLTLDYCDLTLNGKTEKDLYFYQAQMKTYQRHGLEKNPWDNGVQYKTSILDRDRFDPTSGFAATFHFTVEKGVRRQSLRLVVERPELFRVAVNGHQVAALSRQWWLDKSFGLYEIGRWVKDGENTIEVSASPFTINSELEPVYLLGDFLLRPAEKGFRLVPASLIRPGRWDLQGLPFYSEGVRYSKEFHVAPGKSNAAAFVVGLGKWKGAVARVLVNGKDAGCIAFAPYEQDITKLVRPGRNEVSVIVYGTLKNTLGPHHRQPPLGRAWPGQFQVGAAGGYPPGTEYSVVGYGLFEDFMVKAGRGARQ